MINNGCSPTRCVAVGAADSPAEHRQADSRLHLAIVSLTASPQLIDAVTGVQAQLNDMLLAIPVLPVNIEHSSRQHSEIVDRDPVRPRPGRPPGDGEPLRRHGRAAARAAAMRGRIEDHD